jgi:MFS family permease
LQATQRGGFYTEPGEKDKDAPALCAPVKIKMLRFLFTFFDIFDINVSFIQTCTQIVVGCNPENAANYLGLPLTLNLVGYAVGSLILSPLADRFGRRDMLLITLIITCVGSLWNAFAGDYTTFILARVITGVGVGADLAAATRSSQLFTVLNAIHRIGMVSILPVPKSCSKRSSISSHAQSDRQTTHLVLHP